MPVMSILGKFDAAYRARKVELDAALADVKVSDDKKRIQIENIVANYQGEGVWLYEGIFPDGAQHRHCLNPKWNIERQVLEMMLVMTETAAQKAGLDAEHPEPTGKS